MLLYVLESTTAIPFSLIFPRFVSLLFNGFSTLAKLIARLPRYSRISSVMYGELHWLPLPVRIQFEFFILISKAQRSLAPKYLVDVILRPHSASSQRQLRYSNRLYLLVPRSRTAMAQSRFLCFNWSLS